MDKARPLPDYLVRRYHGWKATTYADNSSWYQRLADEGQRPRAMIISCCDSRVHVTSIFGADEGEFFIHRNIAGLVPPYGPSGDYHGTSAAVEYAVTTLKVSNLLVLGHSNCGGVAACDAMAAGDAPELEQETSFIGRWMDILRPGYDRVKSIEDIEERVAALEKQAVIVSLENLMDFPFVKEAIANGDLSVHGLWHDIAEGEIEHYSAELEDFVLV